MAQKELGRSKQQRQLGPGENFKDLPDREERIVEPRQGSLPPPPGAPEQIVTWRQKILLPGQKNCLLAKKYCHPAKKVVTWPLYTAAKAAPQAG